MIVNCLECGKLFTSFPSERAKGEGKYCSRICYGKSHSKSMTGSKHHNWKGGNIASTCRRCGKKIFVSQSVFNSGKGKFCGRECYAEWQSINKTGRNNPRWKKPEDRKTPIRKYERRTLENKLWRESVYKRDNYTCQKCGKRGVVLNAHHIQSFINHIDKRFILSNGITLCVSCHKKEHLKKEKYHANKQRL